MSKLKEIAIISGKGGTGKTSVTASLASLFRGKVMADCDVDAANLHLVLKPRRIVRQSDFTGGGKASIDPSLCTRCGMCRKICMFAAISVKLEIDRFACEGCGACYDLCPAHAIDFSESTAGTWFVTETADNERFVYAELFPGEDNSGKLVAAVRNEARIEANAAGKDLIILDGPPGIGCPVISSITGTDLVIIVTEPTPTGVHDLERVIALVNHFRIKAAVIVNKYDINSSWFNAIKDYCSSGKHEFLGEIPYEPVITEAQKAGEAIIKYRPDCEASRSIIKIYENLGLILEKIKEIEK